MFRTWKKRNKQIKKEFSVSTVAISNRTSHKSTTIVRSSKINNSIVISTLNSLGPCRREERVKREAKREREREKREERKELKIKTKRRTFSKTFHTHENKRRTTISVLPLRKYQPKKATYFTVTFFSFLLRTVPYVLLRQ